MCREKKVLEHSPHWELQIPRTWALTVRWHLAAGPRNCFFSCLSPSLSDMTHPLGFCKVAGEADNVMLVFHQRPRCRSGDGAWPPEHLKALRFPQSAVLKSLLFFHTASCGSQASPSRCVPCAALSTPLTVL